MRTIFTYKGNQYSYEIVDSEVQTWQLTISDKELEEEGIKAGDFQGLCEKDITLIIKTVQSMDDIPYRKL